MNEIICPKCKNAFKIDEAGYADILKQVRDREFQSQLNKRIEQVEKEKEQDLKLNEVNLQSKIEKLTHESGQKIKELEFKLESKSNEVELVVGKAVREVEKERDGFKTQLEKTKYEKEISEKNLKDKYENQIKDRDDTIERMKDLKAKLSTKMVGETLEQHCEIEFNKLRSTGFQKAYFEKDNDARTGSKGDYIFKDFDEFDNEIVSIMFEMKNESDTTATKSKNEDFFKELDKDRNEKGCEYAVLVSLLEQDNELYNSGILDVSHRYKKMYVIRPQFFLPIITLLRNASEKSLKYKNEIERIKAQNIDITNFENELMKFKHAFGKDYERASRQFSGAIDQIDKSIQNMHKIKEQLQKSINSLRLANNKAEDMSIKRLTKNNPTMTNMFKDLNK